MLHRVTHTIMQNIMKIFHKAMKIRKYLRLSKNSLILSPRNQQEKLLHMQNTLDKSHFQCCLKITSNSERKK